MDLWARIDRAPAGDAAEYLRGCCGSTRWIERMLVRRPFGSRERLLSAAREEWFALSPQDWKEAFSHHPKIGDRDALRTKFAATRDRAAREQAGVTSASDGVIESLAENNRRYEETFGYIFIVCATGKSADDMLALLRARLENDSATEIQIAAEEQMKITELRLSRE